MKEESILTLLSLKGFGRKSVKHILDTYKSQDIPVTEFRNIIREIKSKNDKLRFPIPESSQIIDANNKAKELIESSSINNIDIISIFSPDYPQNLINIEDYPLILYCKGNKGALNSKYSIAVVGTREPTQRGSRLGERLSEVFTENGFTIISGLALGCDTVAHKGCLKLGGITVSVLAHGLDMIYPKENKALASEIIDKKGCLVSEYPVGEKPRANYFVERDRLQSGLSQAVIVIQTDIKGGTMHTVGFAEKQSRRLAVLYYLDELDHPKNQGNKMLIDSGRAIKLSIPSEINNFISDLKKDKDKDGSLSLKSIKEQNLDIQSNILLQPVTANTDVLEIKKTKRQRKTKKSAVHSPQLDFKKKTE